MNAPDSPRSDRIFRTATWLYVVPRAAKGILVPAIVGLAAFMVFVALALSVLRRLGA